MNYQVRLETFQGPLDLLLYLVKRNEVDIRDIPIARITEQFLDYVRVIEFVDVEHAGEFLVMAATLMEIKSRMLLPRSCGEMEEEDDPRSELVRQLVEYRKFKQAASLLEAQAERQHNRLARIQIEMPPSQPLHEQPLRTVELWDLVSAFGRLMRETLALQPQQIVVDDTPVQVHQDRIMAILECGERLTFRDVFAVPRNRARLVGLFLALLELIKSGQVVAEQGDAFGEIWLRSGTGRGDSIGDHS
jgi:segregation and condensation protein A